MNFFTTDPALKEAIETGSYPIKIKIILTTRDQSTIEIPNKDIKQTIFLSKFTSPGVITAKSQIKFTYSNMPNPIPTVTEVKIHLSCGNCGIYLHRFTLTPDDKKLKKDETGGKKPLYTLTLEDTPARINRLGGIKDWTTPQMLIDSTICDKENPENSLFHNIASKAGIEPSDTESCTINLPVPYAYLNRTPWAELCDLTDAVHATLEGGIDKKLILSESRYQEEEPDPPAIPTLQENLFYKVEEETAGDILENDIRLRWNKPERLSKQTLWEYSDPPINYNYALVPSFPFSLNGNKRDIETNPNYQAHYTAILPDGGEEPAVYADQLDTITEIENRMETENGFLSISNYNTTAHSDKAIINISCIGNDELENLTIEGRPIVIRKNCSYYLTDEQSITDHGRKILNRTGKYFLDADVDGIPYYQDWTEETLQRNKNLKRRFKSETQYCLFYIRSGALTYFERITGETILCKVTSLLMEYTTEEGFTVKTTLEEET